MCHISGHPMLFTPMFMIFDELVSNLVFFYAITYYSCMNYSRTSRLALRLPIYFGVIPCFTEQKKALEIFTFFSVFFGATGSKVYSFRLTTVCCYTEELRFWMAAVMRPFSYSLVAMGSIIFGDVY